MRKLFDVSAWEFFSYELPQSKVAQRPVGKDAERSSSKLLNVKGLSPTLSDHVFSQLPSLLERGDLLVFNNSKVIPARLLCREPSSGTEFEIFLLSAVAGIDRGEGFIYRALAKPQRKLRVGMRLQATDALQVVIEPRTPNAAEQRVRLIPNALSLAQAIHKAGLMPIPPYIRDGLADEEDVASYQNIYAEIPGSVACSTAGLHFSKPLFEQLDRRGIERRFVTLHIGPASFLPLNTDGSSRPQVGAEQFGVSLEVLSALRQAVEEGRRIIAVGTSVARTLETIAEDLLSSTELAELSAKWLSSSTSLTISPGYNFKLVDALITNFHQPRSSHLLLVAAFSGPSSIEAAYRHALENQYRFLSYGDSMFLEPG